MNYYMTAAALRVFSSHPVLRSVYRSIGKRRTSRTIYIPKPRWIWEEVIGEGVDKSGHTLLELGTGWVHAGSLYAALLIDAQIIAFDVSDNRSLSSTKHELQRVERAIQGSGDHSQGEKTRAGARAAAAARASTFSELYDILKMTYVVESGGIPPLSDASVDMIYSQDVLEHVHRDEFVDSIHAWRRILKPNGRFLALVGLDDHLAHYDRSKSMKEYLYHSDARWNRLLENRLQYINRLTATEIVDSFTRNGFKVENFELERTSVNLAAVHQSYRWQKQEDLEATCLRLYARAIP